MNKDIEWVPLRDKANITLTNNNKTKTERCVGYICCPKCGSRLIRAPYVIVCENVMCDFDARRPQ